MWFLATAFGQEAADCDRVAVADVRDIPPPAIIVLGERRGTQPDLWRAATVVRSLARRDEVAVALADLAAHHQPVLDQLATTSWTDFRSLVAWDDLPLWPYKPLLAHARRGGTVSAVGVPPAARPKDATAPIPPGYGPALAASMGAHPVAVDAESAFAQTVAWLDHAVAREALRDWSGLGYLVIVVDRFHVEGGRGVSWQAERLANVPVHAFLLAGAEPLCAPGDRVLTAF